MYDSRSVIFTFPKEDVKYRKIVGHMLAGMRGKHMDVFVNNGYYGPKSIKSGYAIKILGFGYADLQFF